MFYKLKNFFTNYWLIIINALVLTFLISAPLFFFYFKVGSLYQGINIAHFGTDEHVYLSRGEEALEGHGLGNPILRESKNATDYYFNINERVLAFPVRFLGLVGKIDIVTLYGIYNFIGVFILILLIYFFVLQFSGNKSLALITALFVVGGYSIVYSKRLFYNEFNIYGRAMYPYLSSLVLFTYLLLMVKSLKSHSSYRQIWAGLIFGLAFYVYFYTWTFILTFNTIFLGLLLIKKDWSNFKNLLFIYGLGLLIGLYNMFRIASFIKSPIGKQFAYFAWSAKNHTPIFSNLGFVVLVLFIIFAYRHRKDDNLLILLAFNLTGWLTLNQQIITGTVIQYNHYYWFFIVPVSIVSGLYMVWFSINKRKLRMGLAIFLVMIVYLNTSVGQYQSALTTWQVKLTEQQYRPIIDYFNSLSNNTVILAADDADEYLFTIYTKHDLFWGSFANMNDNSIGRFKESFFTYIYLNRNARDDFSGYIRKIMGDQSQESMYKNLYENLEGYWSGFDYYSYQHKVVSNDPILLKQRDGIIDRLTEEYKKFHTDDNIKSILTKYGVLYIVWDENKNPEWDVSVIKGVKEMTASHGIHLYKIEI